MIIFFKFFPMVPHMEFLFTLWYPKGSKKNWPKCHSGQSVSGQSVTLAKESLWPKCHSGQSVTLAKVSLAKVSLWPKCLWPKCPWPKGHSVQSVILAKLSRPNCLWPKCHSGQNVIQPKSFTGKSMRDGFVDFSIKPEFDDQHCKKIFCHFLNFSEPR